MASFQHYEDIFTHRKKSVLPETAQQAIYKLGIAVQNGLILDAQIESFRDDLEQVPAAAVPQASQEIRDIAKLYGGFTVKHALGEHPELGWLYLFHGNGFYRQEAIEVLRSAPRSPFEFTAIVYRLNDWVGNVRSAALKYAARQFCNTAAAVVSESSFFLLSQANLLARWEPEGQRLLKDAF